MSLKRCRALPVVAIVALVASGVIMFIWSQQRRLIYFPSAGPVPSASSVLPAGRDDSAIPGELDHLVLWAHRNSTTTAVYVDAANTL